MVGDVVCLYRGSSLFQLGGSLTHPGGGSRTNPSHLVPVPHWLSLLLVANHPKGSLYVIKTHLVLKAMKKQEEEKKQTLSWCLLLIRQSFQGSNYSSCWSTGEKSQGSIGATRFRWELRTQVRGWSGPVLCLWINAVSCFTLCPSPLLCFHFPDKYVCPGKATLQWPAYLYVLTSKVTIAVRASAHGNKRKSTMARSCDMLPIPKACRDFTDLSNLSSLSFRLWYA